MHFAPPLEFETWLKHETTHAELPEYSPKLAQALEDLQLLYDEDHTDEATDEQVVRVHDMLRVHYRVDKWIAVVRYCRGVAADSDNVDIEDTVATKEPYFHMLIKSGPGIFNVIDVPWSIIRCGVRVSRECAEARVRSDHPRSQARVVNETLIELEQKESGKFGIEAVRDYYAWMRPGLIQRPVYEIIRQCEIKQKYLHISDPDDGSQSRRRSTRQSSGHATIGPRR